MKKHVTYLSNSVIIITGAGSGIGRELTLRSAALNAYVIAVDNNLTELEHTVHMGISGKRNVMSYLLDTSDQKAIFRFTEGIIPILKNRRLVLINNAHTVLLSGRFQDSNLKDMESLFNTNFWVAVWLTKAFQPYFIQQNDGHILNVSAISGVSNSTCQTICSASKLALRGFTEMLKLELQGTGIKVSNVNPEGIRIRKTQEITERFTKAGKITQKTATKILATIKKEATI